MATVADLAAALDEAGVGKDVVVTITRGDARHDLNTDVIDLPG